MSNRMVFFGASNYGSLVYSYIDNKEDVICFCDNSTEKWGNEFCDIEIIPPKKLLSIQDARIVITSQYILQITKQLFDMGIKKVEVAEIVPDNRQANGFKVEFKKYDYSDVKNLNTVSNRICLISSNNSGSNTYALYKLAPELFKQKYDLKLLKEYDKEHDYYLNLITCKMIIGTYGTIDYMHDKLSLELWHGFPLKGLGSMIYDSTKHDDFTRWEWNNIDKIASYSQLYSVLMSASYGTHINQFFISGMPRNDFLFNTEGKRILSHLLDQNFNTKSVIFYMPTFRESAMKHEKTIVKKSNNIFGFECFDISGFNQFLEENKITLIAKLHQFEEEFVINTLSEYDNKNIHILSQNTLEESGYDLYEVLNAADLLITDYSSVYFDYLLLDRPVLFTPIDLEHYRKTRGFLLEPYEYWTPGPKVITQDVLQDEMLKLLNDKEYYNHERNIIKKIVHHYTDGKSTDRVLDMVDKMIKEY